MSWEEVLALHLNPLIIIIIVLFFFFFFLPFSWCPAFDFPGLLLPGGTGGSCSEDFLGSPWRCFALLCILLPGQPQLLPSRCMNLSGSLVFDQPTVGLTVVGSRLPRGIRLRSPSVGL